VSVAWRLTKLSQSRDLGALELRLWIGVSLGEITFTLIQETVPGTWELLATGIDNGDEVLLGGTGGGSKRG
jgi:hypothetical protein